MKVILKSLICLSLAASIVACNNDNTATKIDKTTERLIVKEQIKEGDVLMEEYEFDKIQQVRHGKSTMYYPSGKVMVEQNYENNQFHGPKTFYYESGQISSKENYEKGKKVGPFIYFFENGKVKQEGTYDKSAIVGVCKTYYENGNLKELVTFVEGWENGPFEEYSEKGIIAAKGNYIPNPDPEGLPLEHGILEEYDENGTLQKKKECENGICYTIWDVVKGDIKPQKLPIPK